MKSIPRRPSPRHSHAAGSQLAIGLAALGAMMLIARELHPIHPPLIDRQTRRIARSRSIRAMKRLLSPLFLLGLPGGYITIAYATARGLRRRGQPGGRAIVTAAWLGWLAHRAAKLAYTRQRPRRRGVRRRMDSYPSGHTTGATALALTTAYVLRRRRLISQPFAIGTASIAPIVMGAYRVIDDEHWATDVIGGWLLGTAIGLGCNAVLADSVSRGPRRVTASEASSRVRRRRGRQEPRTFAREVGRADYQGDRAGTARPFAR
jgi:membrane-associated phospholipid phosphatase